eukprot:scaffold39229_cov60-Attheya_sp.AAC.6
MMYPSILAIDMDGYNHLISNGRAVNMRRWHPINIPPAQYLLSLHTFKVPGAMYWYLTTWRLSCR